MTAASAATGVPRAPALVLGGGLLGGHVAAHLATRGVTTVAFSRSFNPWLQEIATRLAGLRLIRGVIGEHAELARLIEQSSCVYFLAGSSTPTHADRHTARAALDSVLTALTVMDLMRNAPGKRMVLASSGGTIYGEPLTLPTPETHELAPVSMHGLNSEICERYARFYAEHHGLEITVLRYSNVYGPGQLGRRGQGVIATWARALLRGEPITLLGGAETRRDFVYADDAARATVDIGSEPDATGVFNVGAGDCVALSDLLDLVVRTSGRITAIERRPRRPVDVSATALDCRKLRERIGWVPEVSLEEGVKSSWQWIVERFESGQARRARV